MPQKAPRGAAEAKRAISPLASANPSNLSDSVIDFAIDWNQPFIPSAGSSRLSQLQPSYNWY